MSRELLCNLSQESGLHCTRLYQYQSRRSRPAETADAPSAHRARDLSGSAQQSRRYTGRYTRRTVWTTEDCSSASTVVRARCLCSRAPPRYDDMQQVLWYHRGKLRIQCDARQRWSQQ